MIDLWKSEERETSGKLSNVIFFLFTGSSVALLKEQFFILISEFPLADVLQEFIHKG